MTAAALDRNLLPPAARFTEADIDAAHAAWGCNCGPGALAAICQLTLDQVRPLIPGFEAKRYTSPQMMRPGIENAGWRITRDDRNATRLPREFPAYGLVRVQWEGPWRGKWAYWHTHWIASVVHPGCDAWIFDINAGWQTGQVWASEVVPWLIEGDKRRTGGWHATHRWHLAKGR